MRFVFISNSASGSFDPVRIEQVLEEAGKAGWALAASFDLSEDQCPDRAQLEALDAELLAVFGGDGTINHAVDAAAGWHGSVVALPGGTMNVLPRMLHGDAGAEAIIAAIAAGSGRSVHLPCIEAAGRMAYVGVIAGPVTAWAEVRERLRGVELIEAGKAAAEAISQSVSGEAVRLDDGPPVRAIFLTPARDGIGASTIALDHTAQLAELAWHWLSGDWRDATAVTVVHRDTLTVGGPARLDLLFDGEPVSADAPLTFVLGQGPLSFIATADEAV